MALATCLEHTKGHAVVHGEASILRGLLVAEPDGMKVAIVIISIEQVEVSCLALPVACATSWQLGQAFAGRACIHSTAPINLRLAEEDGRFGVSTRGGFISSHKLVIQNGGTLLDVVTKHTVSPAVLLA